MPSTATLPASTVTFLAYTALFVLTALAGMAIIVLQPTTGAGTS